MYNRHIYITPIFYNQDIEYDRGGSNMKEKNRWMYVKRILKIMGLTFGPMAIVFAVWLLTTSTGMTGFATSTSAQPLEFTVNFDDIYLDSSNSTVWDYTEATLLNSDGIMNDLEVNISIVKTDYTNDSCTDYASDVEVIMWFDGVAGGTFGYGVGGQIITNGDTINLPSGTSTFRVEMESKFASCPQTVDIVLSLTAEE